MRAISTAGGDIAFYGVSGDGTMAEMSLSIGFARGDLTAQFIPWLAQKEIVLASLSVHVRRAR